MKHLLISMILIVAAACESDELEIELPDWSEGYPVDVDAGTGGDDAGGWDGVSGVMTIRIADDTTYDYRFGLADDQDSPCRIETGGVPMPEIHCRLDVPELDLFFHGFAYTVEAPAGTCDYLGLRHYMYQAWALGGGPDGPVCDPAVCDCYAGAAFMSSVVAFDGGTGCPLGRTIVDLPDQQRASSTVRFDGPINHQKVSNVALANYLDPAYPVPTGLLGEPAQRHYEIECLDAADEVSARVLLSVREWDEVAEFDANGDPDSGIRPGNGLPRPREPNGSGSYINDYYDWSDFAVEEIMLVGDLD